MGDLDDLRCAAAAFAAARDWQQFHSPKNLAMAVAAEAGELLEPLQWLTEAQSDALDAGQRAAVTDEMADVFLYLLLLADRLDVDLVEVGAAKLARNEARYPVELAAGNARKHDQLRADDAGRG